MMYEPGDMVYPTDLSRRVICRVVEAEQVSVRGGSEQILKLAPLPGQRWHLGTSLVRWGDAVLPVRIGDLWRAGAPLGAPPVEIAAGPETNGDPGGYREAG